MFFTDSDLRSFSAPLVGAVLLAISAPANAQANEAAALADMQAMAQAMDIVALDTTFYVSLENLNDLSATNTINPFDSIQDLGGPFVMIPSQGTFIGRRNLATAFNEWKGPYVTYQSGTIQTGTTPYDQGSRLDPWGNPYYLFNPLGLIRGDQGLITLELYGDMFDRYVIVTLGPDGVLSGDDLFFNFGGGISGTHLTSLSGNGVTLTSAPMDAPTYDVAAGTTVTLRGVNFGAASPTKSVLFGSTVLSEVLSWGNREITVVVPETLSGTEGFKIQLGSGSTNSIQGTITGSDTSVHRWMDY